VSDEKPAADSVEEVKPDVPAAPEPMPLFPRIKRQVFDVLHDDERNEVWIGLKLRQTMKGQKVYPNGLKGPVEDVEVNIDAIAAVVCLDSAKQEVLLALSRDSQLLNDKRNRQAALKGNGILDRLTAGLGKAFSGKPS
jgi:hypothetical protein